VFNAALDKQYRLLHSIDYRADLARVLRKDKFAERLNRIGATADDIVETIYILGEGVHPVYVPMTTVRDKDDIIILACAAGGNADYIVTGDDDLLVLKEYKGIRIVTPAEFIAILLQNPSTESLDGE
jgi:hypothetical protein